MLGILLLAWIAGGGTDVQGESSQTSYPNQNGKWALHYAGPHDSRANTCDFTVSACESVTVDAPSGPGRYDIYVLGVDVDEVLGTRFGLSCDGPLLFYGWMSCGELEIPTDGWPGCGEGNAVTWGAVPAPGPTVTVGILDVYVYGGSVSLSTGPDPRVGHAEWCDNSDPAPLCFPTAAPSAFSTIGFGGGGSIDCAAAGSAGCDVSPSSLEFGGVEVGSSTDLDFTISNPGTWIITGSVEETCEHYEIVAGGGSYALGPGGSHVVTVRFSPASTGTRTCTIDLGEDACSEVACSGRGLSWGCYVAPGVLDFGKVECDSSSDLTFTVTNTGTETLSGTISESCDAFEIVSGGGAYTLVGGEPRDVTVRFTPTSRVPYSCSIDLGSDYCTSVSCTGEGSLPLCETSPTSLDFGTVPAGTSSDLSFTITNTGSEALSGTVTESCSHYEIAGGSSYSLEPGEWHLVTVRFRPTAAGTFDCTVDTGLELCPNVSCTGHAVSADCDVSPASLNFGEVEIGSSADSVFTISNLGSWTLNGTVSESCSYYAIVSGGGPYSLDPGESREVTVRFSPTVTGWKNCTVNLGEELCPNVSCTGKGISTSCEVSPASLSFGTVLLGSSSELSFTITNTGTSIISGSVTESCDHYAITAGGGPYSLASGESREVTVAFEPTATGDLHCTVDTGLDLCSDVTCSGRSSTDPPPPPPPGRNANGKWALHYAGPHDSVINTCDFLLVDCVDLDVAAPGEAGRYDIYVIAAEVVEVAGTRYGLFCDGPFYFYGWTSCADLEIPTPGWPGCAEGIAQTFSTPRVGPYVTLGILDVYSYGSPSSLSAGIDPRVGFAEWCDGSQPSPLCNSTTSLWAFGVMGFGEYGYNPCGVVPTELVKVSAEARGGGIFLQWRPSSASSFERFYVHRSAGSRDGDYSVLDGDGVRGGLGGEAGYSYMDADVVPGTLYYYKLEGVRRDGEGVFFGPYQVMATEVKGECRLSQNVPNPMSRGGVTTIHYSVAQGGEVRIRILDAAGRLVRAIRQDAGPGPNSVTWDGRDAYGRQVPEGVYFYEIRAGGFAAERKMVVVD